MTPNPATLIHADQIIRDIYQDLTNKGAIGSFIEPGAHTADFELSDNLKMRVKEEKNVVFYHVFRAK